MRKKHIYFREKIKLFLLINWLKTFYINFKMLPFYQAKRLPIVVYGKCVFKNLDGKIILEGDSFFGKIGIGQRYQMFKKEKGITEFHIIGEIRFGGRMQFGMDCRIYIGKNAVCTLGDMSSLGGDSTLICTKKVSFGVFSRAGTETYITDSNFHKMKNTITEEVYPMLHEIKIGSYNFIGTRVIILGKTKTPDYTTVSSFSLVNKDFSNNEENILIGGIPAKIIKKNIKRDWEAEEESLIRYLTIKLL